MEEPPGGEDHALTEFLYERLPTLGLDAGTYAPYLLPLLTEDERDDEEWESVMELLRASPETHGDDTDAFVALRRDIARAWQDHRDEVSRLRQVQSEQRVKELEQTLLEERKAVEAALVEAEEQRRRNHAGTASTASSSSTDDAAKRALLSRFAYDVDDDDGGGGGGTTKKGGDADAAPLTNQQIAELAKQEAQQALRGKSVQTKKEEQQKTAQARLEKARLKEERRKKATKGERKR